MARKPRIEYPGAFYHVITRGNRKAAIFKDDKDRLKFLQKLTEYKKRYNFILYAYSLMDNHIHLLLETGDVSLSKIMQGLLQSYTQWYNGKYGVVGHLFQGRFKSILCDKREYLLNLIRYIHLNSVRAGLVRDPLEYMWSSHRIYLGIERSDLVDCDLVLSQFSKNRKEAIKLYERFVLEWIDGGKRVEFYRTVDQRFLGKEEFVEGAKQRVREEFCREENILKDKTLEGIVNSVKRITGVSLDELRGGSRREKIIEMRSIFVCLAIKYTDRKRKEIASFLGRTAKMVCHLERKVDGRILKGIEERLGW